MPANAISLVRVPKERVKKTKSLYEFQGMCRRVLAHRHPGGVPEVLLDAVRVSAVRFKKASWPSAKSAASRSTSFCGLVKIVLRVGTCPSLSFVTKIKARAYMLNYRVRVLR